jgi:heme-degrading monooxygenase HmoA
MAVMMNTEIPGADASFMDGMREAGVVDAIAKAPGFVSHASGVSPTGYQVVEVWESREAHQAWFDTHIAPNLPPGLMPTWVYTDLVIAVP